MEQSIVLHINERKDSDEKNIINISFLNCSFRHVGSKSRGKRTESDKKLYVAYSSTTEGYNRNSAELAIIDIEDLK